MTARRLISILATTSDSLIACSRGKQSPSGQVYETVILKERRGDYLGKTVQVIPHVTDVIKDRIRKLSDETNTTW